MQWLSHPITLAVISCVLLQLLAWNKQRVSCNADTVDMAWAVGIIACAIVYTASVDSSWQNMLMVLLFPIIWYLRLSYHLFSRYDVQHEDSRYQNLRAHWSNHTQAKFLGFFMFQAGLSVLFSLTAYWVLISKAPAVWQMMVAVILGIFALVGVTVADNQLHRFKKSHESTEVCDVGLWRYSRHPNYFFEWLHWFVYPIILWDTAYFWWSWLVVGMMLVFLLKLTGIPFSEQQALKKRGQAYRDYMNKTSAFIPWRVKHA